MPRLVPLPRRRSGAAHDPPPVAVEPPAEDELVLFELRVARTADLLLKVAGLLDREARRVELPGRAARITKLAWAADRAQSALLDAAADPGSTGAGGLAD